MKTFALVLTVFASIALIGCGHKHEEGHSHTDHSRTTDAHGHDAGDDQPDEADALMRASFAPGQGVILPEETRRNIGLETAAVTERTLPIEFRMVVQVFGENHKSSADETHHAECTAKAAGVLPLDRASQLQSGLPVKLSFRRDEKYGGVVLGKSQAVAGAEIEIVVGITNSGTELKPGDFLAATISIPRDAPVVVAPESAILRSAEGAYAYVQKETGFLRVPIQTGAASQGLVEITKGLSVGDIVVTRPVERLWLIELRATRGGGHSH